MRKGIGIGIVIAVVGLILIVGIDFFPDQDEYSELKNMSIEELQELSVSWYYDDLLRNPEKYKGKIIHFTAEVFKVQQKFGGNYQLEVQTDCPYPDWRCGNFVVDYTGSRILQNDIVRVYAQVDYVDNYTILGTVLPVPYVTAVRLSCVNC